VSTPPHRRPRVEPRERPVLAALFRRGPLTARQAHAALGYRGRFADLLVVLSHLHHLGLIRVVGHRLTGCNYSRVYALAGVAA
jgi:hypothetical protein